LVSQMTKSEAERKKLEFSNQFEQLPDSFVRNLRSCVNALSGSLRAQNASTVHDFCGRNAYQNAP
jgi:hypothetical protein